MAEEKGKKVEKFTWLIAKPNGIGTNIFCNRKLALDRELALKNKSKCTKLDLIELMAIKLCLNNNITEESFYFLSNIKI